MHIYFHCLIMFTISHDTPKNQEAQLDTLPLYDSNNMLNVWRQILIIQHSIKTWGPAMSMTLFWGWAYKANIVYILTVIID